MEKIDWNVTLKLKTFEKINADTVETIIMR